MPIDIPKPSSIKRKRTKEEFEELIMAGDLLTPGEIIIADEPAKEQTPKAPQFPNPVKPVYVRKPHLTARPLINHQGLRDLKSNLTNTTTQE